MPDYGVQAFITLGNVQITFDDILKKFTHVRGFGMATSYCIVEVAHTQSEIMTQFMNHGIFTIKYGNYGVFTETIPMQLVAVENSIQFSETISKFIGVEPGFVRLAERDRIKSYPESTVADVFRRLASDNDILNTTMVQSTSGQYTFVQPNVSDLYFLQKYMLPIATTSSNDTPFLFTIDEGRMHLHPPNLGQAPTRESIIDFSINTNVKKFSVKNDGFTSDFTFGNTLKTYGYDHVAKGVLQHDEFTASVNAQTMNQFPYESNFNRNDVLPYEQQWMVDAHNKNKLGASAFNVLGEAVIEGSPLFKFNEIWRFSIPLSDGSKAEYSGDYYVYSIAHVLERRSYLSYMNLRTNSFSRNQKIGQAPM